MVMVKPMMILTVEIDAPDGLILTFSDGTTAAYLVDEMLELRPYREPTAYPSEIVEALPHPYLSFVKGPLPN